MDEAHPLTFLAHTAGLWAVLAAGDPSGDQPNPIDFVQSLIEVDARETTANLRVLRHFMDDQLLAQRVDRALASRATPSRHG